MCYTEELEWSNNRCSVGQIRNHTEESFTDFRSFSHFQYQSMPVLSNRYSSTDNTHALTSSCCLSSLLNGTCICPLLLLLDHVIWQAGVGGSLTHPFNPLHTGWLKIVYCFQTKGYAGSASGKETACQCRRHRFDPWARKIPPEEGMATHSSILAWRIPWTEEPGGLWSMGSQWVGQVWAI